ncbi:MAG TPA: ArsA family ATPase [Solirubrobacteraceae bacterium]|nr:ArsA family ATPase [Solirubrobacteraceae bacterium]
MTPRTILYTGKGGVGKTSVAAATAVRCAASGRRTLILSTDPAHSLADSLQTELGAEPREVSPNLAAAEIDAQHELSRHWAGVQEWFGSLLMQRGLDRISAEELTVPPGMDELFSLLRLKEFHAAGEWDVIIVDCAPTGETLRLLSFPDAARWWLEKVVPLERAIMAAAAPLARTVLDIPLPTSAVFDDVQRLSANLIAMDRILRDTEHSTIRLVMAPDRMVIGEAMRTFTYLNLYGYLTDAVVVNKVFPADVGAYFSGWREHQQEQLELVRSGFEPVPVLEAPYFEQEVIGPEMLAKLGETLFGADVGSHPATTDQPSTETDPAAILHDTITQSIESDADSATLRLAIPFTKKQDIGLKQVGLELVVTAGGRRRTIMLPPTLAAYKPVSATYVDGTLEVAFSRGD